MDGDAFFGGTPKITRETRVLHQKQDAALNFTGLPNDGKTR